MRLCWRRLLRFALGNLRVEGSALKTIGSLRDVSSLQDPEAVLTSGVPHSDGLAVLVNVAVLAHPLPVGGGLLPVHGPVLLGEGCAEPAVSSVESLLLQDFGILRINKLTAGSRHQARNRNLRREKLGFM